MNFFSILSLLASTLYFYLGFYALKLDPRARPNRIFWVLCLDLTLWAFAYSFVYSAPNKEILWIWYKISVPAWCLIGGLSLHSLLILTHREALLKQKWIYPLLYVPGTVFTFRAWTGVFVVRDFVNTPLGWFEVGATDSIWLWLHTLNYTVCLSVGLHFTYRWGRKSKIRREKKQAKIIIFTVVLSYMIGVLFNLILPVLQIRFLPALAQIILLVWALGMWKAIVSYRLMVLSPTLVIEEILFRMKDILIVMDSEGKINKINSQAKRILGYGEEELLGQPIGMIIKDEEIVHEIILKITNPRFSIPDRAAEYQTKKGELIPVNCSCSMIKDNLGDVLGVVLIGEDLRPTRQLKNEIVVRKRAEDALLNIHDELEIRIQERTDELFRTNTALQEEVSDRQEAEKLFKVLFMRSPIGTYIVQSGKARLVNPEFERVTGYNEKELKAISCLNLVHPEDREKVRQNAVRMLKGEQHYPYEFRIMTKDGRTRWILETVTSIRYQGFPATLGSFMDFSYRKEAEEIIHQLAYYDSLTGLANRALFLDQLSQALVQIERSREKLTLMMLDLDHFKTVNDDFGHNWGDLLLKEVGQRLIQFLRKSDTVARLGGDEFIILLPKTGDESDGGKIAEKILEVIQKPFYLDHRTIRVTVSIGLAFFPRDGLYPEQLMKNADWAMVRAKERGRNNYQCYVASTVSQ